MKNDFRQKLHLEPDSGWLNDPNGLSYFGGKYHVYFQYSPGDAYGKTGKCWGHWESPDLINWSFTGAVLRPDCPDDRSGVYSGCAIEKDSLLHLFYTGNVKLSGDYDYITAGREANVIHVVTPDGVKMGKKHTVLRNSDYPDFCSCYVRDPKVWEENGRYYMVLGARTLDDKGCVLYYSSEDLDSWHYEKCESFGGYGYMWECPDVITLSGKKILSISPQGMEHGALSHQNIYSSGYFNGDEFIEWDYGFDFYAPQTFKVPDGRTILIGWMGIGDIPYQNPTAPLGWQHCMTLPRELYLQESGEVYELPVRELLALRQKAVQIDGKETLTHTLPFELDGSADSSFCLETDIFKAFYEDGVFTLSYKDKEQSGGRTERRVALPSLSSIRIFADTSSVEIYLNGCKRVLSSRFYPKDCSISMNIQGFFGDIYSLDGIKITNNI